MKRRIAVAAGHELADVVVKNGKIVDVFNGEILTGDVAIADGMIVGIGGPYEGREVVDAAGRYVAPAFLDGHVHIESAMVPPAEFAKVLLPHGVTGVVADPHEIGNVLGTKGIQFMLDASEGLPFDVFVMLPSCVPATPFENAGATLTAEDLRPFMPHPRVLGLAEVMDYPSVIHAQDGMMEKLTAALEHPGARIDGHAAGLDAQAINVYMTAGIRTDHECVNADEARDRLRRGMYVMIREGTVAKDLEALLPVVTEQNARRCLFVTDDKHLDDLRKDGSVDHNVRLAIRQGLSPITAIQMASLNVAECFGLLQKGAVAPGYEADFLLIRDLERVEIEQVYKSGRLVAEKGQVVEGAVTAPQMAADAYGKMMASVALPELTAERLQIAMPSETGQEQVRNEGLDKPKRTAQARVIGIIPNKLVTNHLIEEIDVQDGTFIPSTDRDLLKMAVIERHHRTGNVGLGIVKGLGFRTGAIATTVAHDSHNIIIAGTNDADLLAAIREIERMQGGLVVVEDGKVLASLSLPIAGLMSDRAAAEVEAGLERLNEAVRKIGASGAFNPFLTLAFLALPVIPKLKLTDLGLFDVEKFAPVSVWV